MPRELRIVIPGVPAPQGSKKHVGNGIMVESSKKVGPWRKAVARALAEAGAPPFSEAVEVSAAFYLPRPRTVRRELPTVPPDLDKLERGLWDALTIAGAWVDDSLVVRTEAVKRYEQGGFTGAVVTIRPARELLATRRP